MNSPRARDDAFGFGALDVVLTARPTPDVTLLVDVEGVVGPGADQALGTLSRLHAEAERLEGNAESLILREAWLRLQLLDGSVRFSIGKLDVGNYFDRNFFAEDETRQFLNSALLSSPLLTPPPNGPGAAIRISQGDWRYAFGVHAPDDVGGDFAGLPYFIAELGRRDIFPLKGHYRWWARGGSVTDSREDRTWGTGVSVDQLIAAGTGVFARAGLSRSDGESLTSYAASAGVQHTPAWLGRAKDLVGIGYGFQRESTGREHVGEVYYNVSLAACCSVIANVEWIFSGPNQVTDGRNRDIIVPGLRAVIRF